ncbi:MAG: 4-hydroxy-tetrahydrodipicolinate reductase [Cyanobacteria bacterium NC_groundwater_1444_Ag_S-0.65um_54_12]|nr:4-hydroxy-tetrahydrodipicolinate reductase [Cyanobacteria bacterium NC_groundwater_1444_Ag_S-0.65um_54_12]
MAITVAINGAAGKMGREIIRAVLNAPDLQLLGGTDPTAIGADCGELAGSGLLAAPVVNNLLELPALPQVVVDFTHPTVVKANAILAIEAGIRPVIGTTGMSAPDIMELAKLAEQAGIGALVAPNFAIGAVLLIRFATEAARHFEHAEIIELHHQQKVDAPSGTALRTAEEMARVRQNFSSIPIHSVRLPGLVAHQEVIFGGVGQTLSLRHDSLSRESFMPGILLGIRRVMTLTKLVYGLEQLL